MTFYGKEPVEPKDKQVRVFTYQNSLGQECIVEAHYVQFMPGHVSFWLDLSADFDTLVRAEANKDVHHLEERR